jgi:hypothetical protein
MSRLNSIIAFLFIGSLFLTITAQEKEGWKEKVKKIKGDVSKIIIQTEDGEVTLTGKDAEEAFQNLKGKSFVIYSDDEFEHKHNKVFYIKESDKGNIFSIKKLKDKNLVWVTEEIDDDGVEKEVEIEIEDGERKVTITTTKDGKESVEVLEGEEAEKYLEEHSDKEMFFGVRTPKIKVYDKGKRLMWIQEDDEGKDGIEKEVKVEIIDGKKKVTITTIKDGKESVEVLEGEKAEKYLEQNSDLKFDDEDGNVMILKGNKIKGKNLAWVGAYDGGEGVKHVNVEVVDGEKVVTVTTTDDGEEKTIILEGVDADGFIEAEEGNFHIIISGDEDCDEEKIKVFVKEKNDEKEVKKIKIKKLKKEKEKKDRE